MTATRDRATMRTCETMGDEIRNSVKRMSKGDCLDVIGALRFSGAEFPTDYDCINDALLRASLDDEVVAEYVLQY